MPIGKRPARRRQGAGLARGATYLLLLFILAVLAVGSATWADRWQVAMQRERETELVFRGLQLRDALQRYHATPTAAGTPAGPERLEDLLADNRVQPPAMHLRRLYDDPFTGRPDWVVLRNDQGGIVGVHSRVERRALRRHGLPAGVAGGDNTDPRSSDWRFIASALRTPVNEPGTSP